MAHPLQIQVAHHHMKRNILLYFFKKVSLLSRGQVRPRKENICNLKIFFFTSVFSKNYLLTIEDFTLVLLFYNITILFHLLFQFLDFYFLPAAIHIKSIEIILRNLNFSREPEILKFATLWRLVVPLQRESN